jgi:hypothetical protein
MVGTEGFQVVHEALDGAARALPNQVSALGDTRDFLLSRQVPASAFANVDASAEASAVHSRTVQENAQQLEKSAKRLEKIIGDVRGTNDTTQEWDENQSKQQNQEGAERIQLAQADTGTRTGAGGTYSPVPDDVHTGRWGHGGAYLEGDSIRLRPRDDTVPSVVIPNNTGAQGFQVGPAYDLYHADHTYRVENSSGIPFDGNSGRIGEAIANNPVPTSGDQPASSTGARNDALWNDYVRSYTVASPDPSRYTDITVNYTIAGEHRLHEGYVIRYGERMPDGTTTLISYGEGNSWMQHPVNVFNQIGVQAAWGMNQREIIRTLQGR